MGRALDPFVSHATHGVAWAVARALHRAHVSERADGRLVVEIAPGEKISADRGADAESNA